MIVRCMLLLWLIALALTSMPVMGFGVYYKGERCIRYREATEPADVAYAYVWFVFGDIKRTSILIECRIFVNRHGPLSVDRLVQPGGFQGAQQTELQSRGTPASNEIIVKSETAIDSDRANARNRHHRGGEGIREIDGRTINIISIPLAQFAMQLPQKAIFARKLIRMFHLAADVLLCIHFTLDPYIYVLLRMPRPRFRLLKPLCKICWPARSRSSSFNGTTDHQGSSGDPSTPITEAPSMPVNEEHDPHLVSASV
ncbi:unnamed protein product [Heterotrigona itama]|uniref:G-protein coupled receptors family 1 profile domain-containing protein n=1 Tax=Heterotrigona itama TaxID=395501 RepID=A0A6V7H5Z7_9HYME|nr:unnamed protein product [Heterotrigona itama]